MTLDTTIPLNPPYILQYGIPVTVFVADQALRTEVWRAPDNAGVPNDGAAVLATTLLPAPQGGVTFIDPLPNDGAIRYYKSRHVDESGNFSSFTAYTEGLTPVLISGAGAPNPMAAFGAIVDQTPPNSRYEIRFAGNYADPDVIDGMQSYIDFPATTNFMRVGKAPKPIVGSTNTNPSVLTVTSHGLVTGDMVTIRGHLINTAINGTYPVTRIDDSTFSVPVAANGTGGATGHVVKLSLVIVGGSDSSSGDLSVYGTVQASTLIANGSATFNGPFRALGGSLVRSLQHSVTGEYGDTNVNRLLLDAGNLLVMGNPGGGTTAEVVRLGTYSIAGAPIARSTASFNSPATGSKGWNDPDGLDNGSNILSHTTNTVTSVPAASRLYVKLGVSTEGDFVDAYDDNYSLQFRVNASYDSGGNPTAVVTATVTIEYSTNSGTNWTSLPGSYTATAGGTSSGDGR